IVALFGLPVAAQDSRASLQVTVEDEVGGVLVSANVSLLNVATGQAREVVTSRQGVATFEGLARGEYKLVASAPGFRTVERPISIGPERPRPVRVQLVVEVTEVVDVEEFRRPAPELAEIEQNADQVNLNDDVLVGIPMSIRGDRIVQFLSRFMNSAAGVPSIVIDGHEVTRLNLPPRAIDELIVNKNPYSAEYRRPGRARIEVVSQDGSESHHHGDATFIFNSSAVSARNPFVQEKPQLEEMVGELGFSGPIRGTKGSFLFAAELGGDRATAAVNALTLNGAVATFVPERQRETFWTGRIDLSPSDRVDVSLRYEYEQELERNGGVGGLILPELARNGDAVKQDVYFTVSHILSAGFVHTPSMHLSYESTHEGNQPPNAPMLIVQGAFEGGISQRFKEWEIFQADFVDTATLRKGRHVFRFGGRFTPSFTKANDMNDFGGIFEFGSLDLFAAGRPYVFRINEGDPRLSYDLHTADAHFQDEIKIRPNFTLMLGVRYDWESIVEDRNNVAPRLAFSWAPGSQKTAIRGGAGMFYERLGGTAYERVQLYGGDRFRALVFNNPSYPNYLTGPGA
ncbi:MAG: TonB-dependent receptor, partial [Acidobacteria bacterium]